MGQLADLVAGVAGIALALVCFAASLAIWYGPGYWAVRDAYKRGQGSSTIVLIWLLLGPFTALVWLAIRPSKTLLEKSPHEFSSSDDALSAAARLDHGGEWSAAKRIYQYVVERWPEHSEYAKRSLAEIENKEAVANS